MHTYIYNIQTLHRMGFHKVSGKWKRKDDKKKYTEEGERSRTVLEAAPASPTRSIFLAPEQPTQHAPSSSIQLSDKQMRKIAHLAAKELKETIRDEFAKLDQIISNQIPRPPPNDDS